uniref:Uncharacterized protein n=1 Tax=Cacopsylla melanoneura TaxID=428564 RepID=A0A8D8SMS3_9HEMI
MRGGQGSNPGGGIKKWSLCLDEKGPTQRRGFTLGLGGLTSRLTITFISETGFYPRFGSEVNECAIIDCLVPESMSVTKKSSWISVTGWRKGYAQPRTGKK